MAIAEDQLFLVYYESADGHRGTMSVRTQNRATAEKHMKWHEDAYDGFKVLSIVGPTDPATVQKLTDDFIANQQVVDPNWKPATDNTHITSSPPAPPPGSMQIPAAAPAQG